MASHNKIRNILTEFKRNGTEKGLFFQTSSSPSSRQQEPTSPQTSPVPWSPSQNSVRAKIRDIAEELDLHTWEGIQDGEPALFVERRPFRHVLPVLGIILCLFLLGGAVECGARQGASWFLPPAWLAGLVQARWADLWRHTTVDTADHVASLVGGGNDDIFKRMISVATLLVSAASVASGLGLDQICVEHVTDWLEERNWRNRAFHNDLEVSVVTLEFKGVDDATPSLTYRRAMSVPLANLPKHTQRAVREGDSFTRRYYRLRGKYASGWKSVSNEDMENRGRGLIVNMHAECRLLLQPVKDAIDVPFQQSKLLAAAGVPFESHRMCLAIVTLREEFSDQGRVVLVSEASLLHLKRARQKLSFSKKGMAWMACEGDVGSRADYTWDRDYRYASTLWEALLQMARLYSNKTELNSRVLQHEILVPIEPPCAIEPPRLSRIESRNIVEARLLSSAPTCVCGAKKKIRWTKSSRSPGTASVLLDQEGDSDRPGWLCPGTPACPSSFEFA